MATVILGSVPFRIGGFSVKLEGVVFTASNLTEDQIILKISQGLIYDTLDKLAEGVETPLGLRNRLTDGGSAVMLSDGLLMLKDKITVKRV